jgi:two-component system invasion response regulator UvrY
MRVLLVDDHPRVRRSLREVLERSLGQPSFGEAGGAAEALRLVDAEPWDVVLLDLSLPDGNGIETLAELRRRRPELPVLVMSMHPEAQYRAAAHAAGATGWVAKGSDPAIIAAAVRGALGAPEVAPPTRSPQAQDDPRWLSRLLHDDLAQTLAALKMNLHLGRSEPDLEHARQRLTDSVALVEQAIATVRRLLARLEESP